MEGAALFGAPRIVVFLLCVGMNLVTADYEYNPETSCPPGWFPREPLHGYCYHVPNAHPDRAADYAGAAHACKEVGQHAHVTDVRGEKGEKLIRELVFKHWPVVSVEPVKIWLEQKHEGVCRSAVVDSRTTSLTYHHSEDCSLHLAVICETKQDSPSGDTDADLKVAPQVYKRHKYGRKGAALMDMSNLALGQQKRSHFRGRHSKSDNNIENKTLKTRHGTKSETSAEDGRKNVLPAQAQSDHESHDHKQESHDQEQESHDYKQESHDHKLESRDQEQEPREQNDESRVKDESRDMFEEPLDQLKESHEQHDDSPDPDGYAHPRHRRALGSGYNGVFGEVLLVDVQMFQTEVEDFFNAMTSHTNATAAYRRDYIERSLTTAEGLYDRLKDSNLTTAVTTGDVMMNISSVIVTLGSIALSTISLGDSVQTFRGAQGMTLWVNRETINTHRQLKLEDAGTEVTFSNDVTVTDSDQMYGLVAVMTHDASYTSLPGSNDTSSMAARIIFAHFVTINNTILPATGSVVITFNHQRAKASDEIDVCANLYTSGGSYVHWSLSRCDEAKYQFSGSATECNCNHFGTYANFQIYNPLAAGLKLLSLMGCAVSLASCLVTALVVTGYQLMKTVTSFVRMMFLISLGAAEAVFITGTAWGDVKGVCGMVALWLHFSTLASFCWLLSYTLLLGNEMRTSKNYYLDLKLYNLIGWMIPACIVTITAIWRYQDYRDPILCWVSSDGYVYLSFVVPAAVIIGIILLFMMYNLKLLMVKKEDMKEVLGRPVAWSGIRSVFFLLPLLGCTWMFAEYSVITRNLLTQLLFAIFNTLLGICIFLFMCHFNAEIRQAKLLRKVVPHSNYTITSYKVPPVDSSYEPSEKYPYPVLGVQASAGGGGGKAGRQGSLLPGAVDDWGGIVGVADRAYQRSVMSEGHHSGDRSRPGSSSNETSSTFLPDSRAGGEDNNNQQKQDNRRESSGAGSKKNKVAPSDRSLQKTDSMKDLLVDNQGPPGDADNETESAV